MGAPEFFTHLQKFYYFPKPLPDAYAVIDRAGKASRYFVLLIDEKTPSFTIDRLIRKYNDYYEQDDWSVTGVKFPAILVVAETSAMGNRLTKQLVRVLRTTESDLTIHITTLTAFLDKNSSGKVWSDVTDPDELFDLDAIS